MVKHIKGTHLAHFCSLDDVAVEIGVLENFSEDSVSSYKGSDGLSVYSIETLNKGGSYRFFFKNNYFLKKNNFTDITEETIYGISKVLMLSNRFSYRNRSKKLYFGKCFKKSAKKTLFRKRGKFLNLYRSPVIVLLSVIDWLPYSNYSLDLLQGREMGESSKKLMLLIKLFNIFLMSMIRRFLVCIRRFKLFFGLVRFFLIKLVGYYRALAYSKTLAFSKKRLCITDSGTICDSLSYTSVLPERLCLFLYFSSTKNRMSKNGFAPSVNNKVGAGIFSKIKQKKKHFVAPLLSSFYIPIISFSESRYRKEKLKTRRNKHIISRKKERVVVFKKYIA